MRHRTKQWLGFLVMVVGACLLLGPFVIGEMETRKQDSFVAEFQRSLARVTQTPQAGQIQTTTTRIPVTEAAITTMAPTAAWTPQTDEPEVTGNEGTGLMATVAPPHTIQPEKTPASTIAPSDGTNELDGNVTPAPGSGQGTLIISIQPSGAEGETAETEPVPTSVLPGIGTGMPEAQGPLTTQVVENDETVTSQVQPIDTPDFSWGTNGIGATEPPVEDELFGQSVSTTAESPETTTPAPTAAVTAAAEPVFTDAPVVEDDFLRAAIAYNEMLVEKGQDQMRTIKDLENFSLDARDYGFSENAIGTIQIPKLNVEVALFLGASGKHMSNGFAVFGMTSLPLGLGEENVAIAGHRGWRGAAMLRDIQMLMPGDPIYITTPWRVLTYLVTEIEIVTPNNISWCKLKPGKTMISLMTCHPYGNHTHRYIVYAELYEEPAATGEQVVLAVPGDSPAGTQTITPVITTVTTATPGPQAEPAVHGTTTHSPGPSTPTAEAGAASGTAEDPAPVRTTGPGDADLIVRTVGPEAASTSTPCAEYTMSADLGTGEPDQPWILPGNISGTVVVTTAPQTEDNGVTSSQDALPVGTPAPAVQTQTTVAVTVTGSHVPNVTANPDATQAPQVQAITLVNEDGTRETILIDMTAVTPDDREYSLEWSDTLILAENSMRPVAYVTAGIVALVGLWLLAATIRDARREKRGEHDNEE